METETEAGGYQRESKAEARTCTRAHTQSHIQECTAKEAKWGNARCGCLSWWRSLGWVAHRASTTFPTPPL